MTESAASAIDGSLERAQLTELFDAKRIAILGSIDPKADPAPILARYRSRYGEHFYFVNPRGGTFGDRPVYPSLLDIPDDIEVAIIMVGMSHLLSAIADCGAKGVRFALVFTAGFSEIGPEGAKLERELGEAARLAGVRILGPNTNTNVFERMPEIAGRLGGKIGLITQSGHNGRPLVQGAEYGIAFSRWVPTGNELDVDAAEVIDFFAHDLDTSVIAGYIEGFRSMYSFKQALVAADEADKPVVLLKIGSTAAGSAMASSHTGHLTGPDTFIDGLFAQYGVTRVRDLDELLETAALFAKVPQSTGPRCCLYSISGGSGALMAELADLAGVQIAELSPGTQSALHEILPTYLSVSNPVDNGGEFLRSAPREDRIRVLDIIANDPGVDVIVVGITGALGVMTDNFAADLRAWAPSSDKPVVVTWNSPKINETGFEDLVASRLPLFRSFRGCFAALAAFEKRRQHAKLRQSRPTVELGGESHRAFNAPGPLTFTEAHAVLEEFGVPLVDERLAKSEKEAVEFATAIGFPVAIKVSSREIPHRSDSGLVRLNVSDASGVSKSFNELMKRTSELHPKAQVEGIIVQSMVADGVEMIVGAVNDRASGPAVMVGMGGVLAEVLQDVALRPLPITEYDAVEMIKSLRGSRILHGIRGAPPVDVDALVNVILGVARLAGAAGPALSELDLNPVLVGEVGASVVDHLLIAADDKQRAG